MTRKETVGNNTMSVSPDHAHSNLFKAVGTVKNVKGFRLTSYIGDVFSDSVSCFCESESDFG